MEVSRLARKCLLKTARSFLGTPYQYNANPTQTNTFDCSSYTQYVYKKCGILLPRNSRQQFQMGTFVALDDIQVGDLLFFTTKKRQTKHGIERVGHVAIYIGNGKMIHTYPKGKKVTISLFQKNWLKFFMGAKRVTDM